MDVPPCFGYSYILYRIIPYPHSYIMIHIGPVWHDTRLMVSSPYPLHTNCAHPLAVHRSLCIKNKPHVYFCNNYVLDPRVHKHQLIGFLAHPSEDWYHVDIWGVDKNIFLLHYVGTGYQHSKWGYTYRLGIPYHIFRNEGMAP